MFLGHSTKPQGLSTKPQRLSTKFLGLSNFDVQAPLPRLTWPPATRWGQWSCTPPSCRASGSSSAPREPGSVTHSPGIGFYWLRQLVVSILTCIGGCRTCELELGVLATWTVRTVIGYFNWYWLYDWYWLHGWSWPHRLVLATWNGIGYMDWYWLHGLALATWTGIGYMDLYWLHELELTTWTGIDYMNWY